MNTVITPVDISSRKNLDMRTGDTVRVHLKIQEKGKTRLQAFEGMILARKHGTEAGATFTVRRNTNGFGVEKIFPLYSPIIEKIEVTKRSKTRRSKLYYIRDKALKEVKKRFKMAAVKFSTEDHKEEVEEAPVEEVKTEDEIVETTPETTEDADEAKDEAKEDETQTEKKD